VIEARRANPAESRSREIGAATLVLALVAGTAVLLAATGVAVAEPPTGGRSAPQAPERPEASAHAPRPEVDWESLPVIGHPPSAFGSLAIWKVFYAAMQGPENPLRVCSTGWRPPPGFATMDLEAELRVRSLDGFLVVEDLIILGGNIGDSEFEECLVKQYRGRRAPAPDVEPDRAFRIAWGFRKWLE
jgi:hypothetical protein